MLIVQKYGGSSVADNAKVFNVAERIAKTVKEGHSVVVVVSAQGKTTDYLINFNACSFDLCNKIRALENCYFFYNGMRFKVLFAVVNEKTGTPGQILSCNGKDGLIIATKDRAIEVVTIQPEGKQKMFAIQYMNANKFVLNDIIQ